MSAALYGQDSTGVTRQIKKLYASVGGVNRELKELWARDGSGVNRKIYQSGPTISVGTPTFNFVGQGGVSGSWSSDYTSHSGGTLSCGLICNRLNSSQDLTIEGTDFYFDIPITISPGMAFSKNSPCFILTESIQLTDHSDTYDRHSGDSDYHFLKFDDTSVHLLSGSTRVADISDNSAHVLQPVTANSLTTGDYSSLKLRVGAHVPEWGISGNTAYCCGFYVTIYNGDFLIISTAGERYPINF